MSPPGRFWGDIVIPLRLSVTKSYPLYSLKTERDIQRNFMHLQSTFKGRVMYKNHSSALDILELFPFDHLQCNFMSAL